MWQNSYDGKSTLFLVPTPIGNMGDITYRALEMLKNCEVIFSEDTRVTSNLLKYFNISKKLISLHEHNEDSCKDIVKSYLDDGFDICLVTDQGTPIISDPGYKTVSYIASLGYNVVALPGATAFVPAVASSSIGSNHFLFYGFLDSKSSKRKKELEGLSYLPYPIVFYEAPHRYVEMIKDVFTIFGNRNISVSREISKKYESIYRGNISNLLSNLGNIKGEYVIVVDGYKQENNNIDLSISDHVKLCVNEGISTMDAIKKVARERGIPKNVVYNEYHLGGRK